MLAALGLARGAVAGGPALVPLAYWLAGVAVRVVIGAVVVLVTWVATAPLRNAPNAHRRRVVLDDAAAMRADGTGLRPGGLVPSDGRDQNRQPLSPGRDEDAPERPGDGSDASHGLGSLELRFDGNADLRHARYTVTYHPDDPGDPRQRVYLNRPVYDSRRVALLPAAQIEADLAAYGWNQQPPPRLCELGTLLSAAQPSCQGVVGVSQPMQRMRGGSVRVRAYATRHPPALDAGELPGQQGLGDAISASARLRLRNAFFAVLTAAGWQHAAFYRIEQDPIQPDRFSPQWLPLAESFGNDSPVFPERVRRIALAQDGSRVYLVGEHTVYEWLGEPGRVRLLHDAAPPASLSGMSTTAHGMCVARVDDDRGALLCRRQSGTWSAPRPFANHMRPPYTVAACGDSVLAVERQNGQPRPLFGAYLRDAGRVGALAQPLANVTLDASWAGGRFVRGLMPVQCQTGRQEFLLSGSFGAGRGGFMPVSVSARNDGSVFAMLGKPFGNLGPANEPHTHAVGWLHPSSAMVRIFSHAAGLMRTDYDFLHRRSVARLDIDVPGGWDGDGGVALLGDVGETRYLVASGWTEAHQMASLLLARINGYLALPQVVSLLDFSSEMGRFSLAPGQAFVHRFTTNTVTLEPVDPDLQAVD